MEKAKDENDSFLVLSREGDRVESWSISNVYRELLQIEVSAKDLSQTSSCLLTC